jgi:glycosyltransferase involved in cell wall biosynthesis
MNSIAIISSQAFSVINFRGELIKAMKSQGLTIYALAPDFTDEQRAVVRSLGAEPVDYRVSRAGMNPLRDAADVSMLARLLRRLRPDATFGYFIKPVIYGSIASWLAGVPRRFSMIEGLGYIFASSEESGSVPRKILRAGVSAAYRLALGLNERIFFLNHDDIELFVKRQLVPREKLIHLDGIGVDLESFRPEPPVTAPVTFLLVARMLREKGVYEFVDAARIVRRQYPETRFLLVGNPDENPASVRAEELASWAAEGLIEWPGQVADVRPWIARASVFVLPSYYREGLPRSTQEAMAMARPVITSDNPGCRETVTDGVNGFLVPVRNAPALAQAMIRFIEQPELVERMGAESRRIAVSRFDVHEINRQILGRMIGPSERVVGGV